MGIVGHHCVVCTGMDPMDLIGNSLKLKSLSTIVPDSIQMVRNQLPLNHPELVRQNATMRVGLDARNSYYPEEMSEDEDEQESRPTKTVRFALQ